MVDSHQEALIGYRGENFYRRSKMEELLITIGELVATEIDDVENVRYVDKEMGYMFYICLKNGKKVLLSLIDSELPHTSCD